MMVKLIKEEEEELYDVGLELGLFAGYLGNNTYFSVHGMMGWTV